MGCRAQTPTSPQKHRRALTAIVFSTMTLQLSAQTPASAVPVEADIVRPLEVTVNGAKVGGWVLIERGGVLYAPKDAFYEWRVMLRPNASGIEVRGQTHYALSSVPGSEAKIDFATQSLALTFSANAFEATRMVETQSIKLKLDPVLPSVFFNYDVNLAANASVGAPSTRNVGALTEIGVSTGAGVLTSTAAGRNLTASRASMDAPSWVRLETTLTRDMPDQNRTLHLGDSSTRASLLGRNAYFGGIQYGSNFALTPGFISQPLPTISGLSAAPSTVELYVNNILRQTTSVPTGPFTLSNLPTINGSGEARLVVRDLLGRETVVLQPFLSSSQLLAEGLSDWSVEAGALRSNLGVTNASYGPGFASATFKQGFNPDLTLESRAEVTRDFQAVSLGAIGVLPGRLLGRAALMSSRSAAQGMGKQWLFGLEYSPTTLNAGVQVEGATFNFRQLGLEPLTPPVKLQIAGNVSYYTENRNSISAAFAMVNRFDAAKISTLSVNYNLRVFGRGNLQFSAGRTISDSSANAFGLTLVVPLEANVITSAGFERRSGQTNAYTSTTGSPQGNGELGWRVLAAQQPTGSRAEGGLNYASRYSRLNGDISHGSGQTALRLGASGGLLATSDGLFASQRVSESFALVEVPGYPDLNVSLGGRVLGRTNASGIAIVPQLVPYQANAIRLDQNDLPISAEIDTIEQSVVPVRRSGVKIVFATRPGRAALLQIMLDDGDVAPSGAVLQVDGGEEEFYVAQRGQAYLTGLLPTSRVTLRWNDQQCALAVALPEPSKDEIARVGPLVCKGVKR